MKTLYKTIVAGALGIAALGMSAAFAARPDICRVNHDHRSHASNYYDYYPADQYSRAGAYRPSGFSFSISFGDSHYDREHDHYDRGARGHDNGRRGYNNNRRGQERRVVNRQVFNTRFNAHIVLVEELVRSRRGPRLLCTVDARGPQAHRVPSQRMRNVAQRNCSRQAQIRILA